MMTDKDGMECSYQQNRVQERFWKKKSVKAYMKKANWFCGLYFEPFAIKSVAFMVTFGVFSLLKWKPKLSVH